MADTKVSQLPNAPSLAPTDLVVVLYNASGNSNIDGGSSSLRTIPVANLVITQYTPPLSNSSGTAGSISFDGNYIYVCISNNVWTRAPLSTW